MYFHLKLSIFLLLFAFSLAASSHNNPTFREDLLLTLDVNAEATDGQAFSTPFSVSWDKKTVQLIWRIESPQQDAITFSVAQNGEIVLENIQHDALSKRIEGEGFTIVNVTGAETPFKLMLYAKVLDRSKQEKH